jgi:hypothetical protein
MSGVRLAAMMPASRAAAMTSPFSTVPRRIRSSAWDDMITRPSATATRSVFAFAPTSTIFMGAK